MHRRKVVAVQEINLLRQDRSTEVSVYTMVALYRQERYLPLN